MLELRISNESNLNFTAPEFVTIAQPTVGFEYTLDIPFTAEAGLHTLGFVSTTTADSGSSQSRSFGIAVEAGRPLPVQRKANNIADTDSGEKLVRMTAARQ